MKNILFLLIFCLQGYAQEHYDVVIIGGGPAGLSAGALCQEMGFRTCIFDDSLNSPAKPPETPPPKVAEQKDQNVPEKKETPKAPPKPAAASTIQKPGEASPSWINTQKALKEYFVNRGGVFLEKKATSISQKKHLFEVSYERETCFAYAIVMATGRLSPEKFSIKEERVLYRLWNEKALSPKDSVILLGQGKPLFTQTIKVANFTKNIFLFPTRTNHLDLQGLVNAFPSISIVKSTNISNISSSKDSVTLQYAINGIKNFKKASYIIVADEWEPRSELVEDCCALDSSKNIVTTNDTFETSVPGIFACGEVTNNAFLTWIQSAAQGQTTGWSVIYYLIEKGAVPKKG